MNKVVAILLVVLIVVVALLAVVAASGLIVWAAAGIGWALINWLRLPFSPFEATLLSLISLGLMAVMVWRLAHGIVSAALSVPSHDENEDYEYEDEDEDEDEYDDDGQEMEERIKPISSIPKWRQPIRRAEDRMPIVDPDDRCPCGSGRKYKNCHGRKK